MRKFLLLSALLIISQLSSQWTQTDGPYGGDAGEIVMVGSDFVLSTGNGGIYRSTNNGNSWQLSNNGFGLARLPRRPEQRGPASDRGRAGPP